MRGRRNAQSTMLAFVDLEERVPRNHPPRVVKQFADRALAELSPVFNAMYATGGRPSIPPERLLKASLLISLLHRVEDWRQLCQRAVGELLDHPRRMTPRHALLQATNANIVDCAFRRPRIHATSLEGGSTVSVYPTRPEEPSSTRVGVFPRPASDLATGCLRARYAFYIHQGCSG